MKNSFIKALFIACIIPVTLSALNYQLIARNCVEYPLERVLDLIEQFIPKNPVILEAGGFDGTDTKAMVQKWPLGTFHVFEPLPESYAKLKTACKNFTNTHCYFTALTDYCGLTDFYACTEPGNEGSSSILPPQELTKYFSFEDRPLQVPCTTIDAWVKNNNIDHVDFMWLDLEGNELKTLQGAHETLKTVKAIYTEVNLWAVHKGTSLYSQVRELLEEEGFIEIWQHFYHPIWVGNVLFVRIPMR